MRPRNFFKIKFMRILCFLLFFVNTITNAQKFTISGKVNDSNLMPLAGASILIDDNKQGTSSDNSGEFSLNLEQGNYKLIISYTGYTSVEKEIELTENKELVITLVQENYIMEEVLVKSVRANSKTPITYSNLNKRENANKILDKINDEEKGIFDSSEKVFRPWGWYETIDGGNNYQVKRIHVYPKEQLSVQKHFHRSERWVVIKGEAEIQVGDNIERYPVGSMISIGKEVIHSLANTTDSDVEIIEVQLGSYLGEDDIIRYEDLYSRD